MKLSNAQIRALKDIEPEPMKRGFFSGWGPMKHGYGPHRIKVIEATTGEVILTQIHLWPNNSGECNMCGQERVLDHAVAWYCGPTHDEIGSVSTEYRGCDGRPAIVGGMCVCKECHDRHYQP